SVACEDSQVLVIGHGGLASLTMDDGRWTMDDGRWTMDDDRYRLSSIVYRPSSIVYRLSSIVHRPSSIVYRQITILARFLRNLFCQHEQSLLRRRLLRYLLVAPDSPGQYAVAHQHLDVELLGVFRAARAHQPVCGS